MNNRMTILAVASDSVNGEQSRGVSKVMSKRIDEDEQGTQESVGDKADDDSTGRRTISFLASANTDAAALGEPTEGAPHHPTARWILGFARYVTRLTKWLIAQVAWRQDRHKNSEAFIAFLEHLAFTVYPNQCFVLVLDNASYHKSKAVQAAAAALEDLTLPHEVVHVKDHAFITARIAALMRSTFGSTASSSGGL